MKSIFTLLLVAMLSAPLSCRAFEEKNILAAGDWSESVVGAEDHHTGRGAHRPIIRGRLLLCESPKNQQPAVYLELQDCGDVWGSTKEIYCDMHSGLTFDLRDMKGEPVPMKPFAFSGGTPGANWMILPCDSTVRLRISPYASFTPASSDDYMISGTFVVDPPADRTGLDVWQGKLKLPAMKIVVPKTIPNAETSTEPLKSNSNPSPPANIGKPLDEQSPSIIRSQKPAAYSLCVKLATKDTKSFPEHPVYAWPWVKSPGAHPFTAGMTVGDLISKAGGLVNDERVKDIPSVYRPLTVAVMRPSSNDPDPVSFVFQFSLDWSKPDGGISSCDFKLQQGDLVVQSMSKVLPGKDENAGQVEKFALPANEPAKAEAPDPIARLVAKLSATTEWENGTYKPIELPESATAEQLVGRVFQTSSPIMANFQLIEARQVEIPTGPQKNYLAALCQTGAARKIVLLQFQNGAWWSRMYDADETVKAEASDPIDRLVARLSATGGRWVFHGEWLNNKVPAIRMSATASTEQVIEELLKFTVFEKGHVKDYKMLQSRDVQIDGASYTAALVQTDLGRKIVLFTAGGAWSRVYDADEAAKNEPPLSQEAQAVLDGLNQKAADPAWQIAIDRIERPETRTPNTVDPGEVTAFLADSKKRLKNLGVSVAWNAMAKRYEVVAESKDVQLAAKAEVVVRAKLLSTDGEADKYARFRVRVLEVFKNSPGAKLAEELLVAAYSGKPGVPDGESTLYLERYNQQSDTGIWKLVGGEASSGVSHSTALAAEVLTAKSQPPMVDLGRVELVDGSPSSFNLGAGRVCTITPTIGFDAVNSYDLILLDGAVKISAPRQTAVVGQPVHISAGQTEVTFVPDVKSKR